MRNGNYRYESVTDGIRIAVEPHYLEEQSQPQSERWVWAYAVEIVNEGEVRVQLLTRHWRITDARGHLETVNGPGVVGEQPVLEPGEAFSYTSGCPLNTPSGFMVGHYVMERADGTTFEAAIPAFSLDVPGSRTALN